MNETGQHCRQQGRQVSLRPVICIRAYVCASPRAQEPVSPFTFDKRVSALDQAGIGCDLGDGDEDGGDEQLLAIGDKIDEDDDDPEMDDTGKTDLPLKVDMPRRGRPPKALAAAGATTCVTAVGKAKAAAKCKAVPKGKAAAKAKAVAKSKAVAKPKAKSKSSAASYNNGKKKLPSFSHEASRSQYQCRSKLGTAFALRYGPGKQFNNAAEALKAAEKWLQKEERSAKTA